MRHLTLICGSVLLAASHANAELSLTVRLYLAHQSQQHRIQAIHPILIFKAVLQIYVRKQSVQVLVGQPLIVIRKI